MAGTQIYNPQNQFGQDLAYIDIISGKIPSNLITIPVASPTQTGTVSMATGALTTIVYDKTQVDSAINTALSGSINTINKGIGSSNGLIIERSDSTVTITLKNANETQLGLVTLSDSLVSDSDSSGGIASTPKAIKDVFSLANSKLSTITVSTVYGGDKSTKGLSLFSEGPLYIKQQDGTAIEKAAPTFYLNKDELKTFLSLGSAANADLSASTSSTSNLTAATSSAVKSAYDLANSKLSGIIVGSNPNIWNNKKALYFQSSDYTISIIGSEGANDSIGLDLTVNKGNLNLGTAAYVNTGILSGNVPVLDANGKLPDSVIGDIALFDKFDVPSADTKQQIVDAINLITASPTPKKGDMIFVLAGAMLGTYWIITTKLPGQYTVNDIKGIQVPAGSVNSISYLGTVYTPTNGLVTLPTTIPWNKLTNVPNASTTNAGIVQLSDTINSTSTTLGATAKAVKQTYDFANTKVASVISDNSLDNTVFVSLDISGNTSNPNILVKTSTAFVAGPIITSQTTQKVTTDWAVTQFIKNRVFNNEVTFTSADVTGTTAGISGTYEYTWTPPIGSTRTAAPRILQVILSTGLTVTVPIQYNDATKKATVLFYDVGDDLTTVYGGVFNTPSNIHRLVLSQTNTL